MVKPPSPSAAQGRRRVRRLQGVTTTDGSGVTFAEATVSLHHLIDRPGGGALVCGLVLVDEDQVLGHDGSLPAARPSGRSVTTTNRMVENRQPEGPTRTADHGLLHWTHHAPRPTPFVHPVGCRRPSGGRRSRRRRRSLLLLLALGAGAAVLWRAGPLGRSTADGVPLDPAAFSPGACVAFTPTSGDRRATVFLDAGHGGLDPGAVGSTSSGAAVDEGTVTLPVELDAARLLRAAGYRVVVSRTTDSNVVRLTPADLSGGEAQPPGGPQRVAARDVCANLSGASVLIGIYFDSGASASDGGSVTTYDGTDRSARPTCAWRRSCRRTRSPP